MTGNNQNEFVKEVAALNNALKEAIYDPNNQPDEEGTHCNNVPPQVLEKLGRDTSDLLNKNKNGDPIRTKAKEQLENLSKSKNWHTVTREEAQRLANQGVPVIAGAPGHIGVVSPGVYDPLRGPLIAQAGDRPGRFYETGSGFTGPVSYYAPNK